MEKIVIIGCGGAGKSTLARALGDKLDLPVVHLDKLFWRPGWDPVSREEFDVLHSRALAGEKWILDGNFSRTLKLRLQYADHVILMNYPTLVCVFRILKRVIINRGKTRDDMTEGCNERLDISFLKYVRGFKKKRLPQMLETLQNSSVPVTQIRNKRELKQFISSIEKQG